MSDKSYNKHIKSVYSLGSEEKSCEEPEEHVVQEMIKNQTLAQIFTTKHPNLITVIMLLMQKRGLQVFAQEKLLHPDDDYWNTGNYRTDELNVCSLNMITLVAAGRIQEVLVAALQILYDVGRKSKEGQDFFVLYYSSIKDKSTNIRINFMFNGQGVNLSIIEEGPDSYMSLYIKD
jgi:hypothetical protein